MLLVVERLVATTALAATRPLMVELVPERLQEVLLICLSVCRVHEGRVILQDHVCLVEFKLIVMMRCSS